LLRSLDIDRRSTYELRMECADKAVDAPPQAEETASARSRKPEPHVRGGNHQSVIGAMMKNVVRSLGSPLGRQIARDIFGSILKGLKRFRHQDFRYSAVTMRMLAPPHRQMQMSWDRHGTA